jgi:hypothetical protein
LRHLLDMIFVLLCEERQKGRSKLVANYERIHSMLNP